MKNLCWALASLPILFTVQYAIAQAEGHHDLIGFSYSTQKDACIALPKGVTSVPKYVFVIDYISLPSVKTIEVGDKISKCHAAENEIIPNKVTTNIAYEYFSFKYPVRERFTDAITLPTLEWEIHIHNSSIRLTHKRTKTFYFLTECTGTETRWTSIIPESRSKNVSARHSFYKPLSYDTVPTCLSAPYKLEHMNSPGR